MSIGSVLALLREDFPDVTISKIRFLEAEGLVTPERAPSGYRRFSQSDCERLRFVLTAQRDRYLPLKVIKEQLDAIDHGDGDSAQVAHRCCRLRAASSHRPPTSRREVVGSPARPSSSEPESIRRS